MNTLSTKKMKAKALDPSLRIGKNGLTQTVIAEIKKQLIKNSLIKIKMLKPFVGNRKRKEVASEIAQATGSQTIDVVGFVVVLHKKEVQST